LITPELTQNILFLIEEIIFNYLALSKLLKFRYY